MPALHVQFLFIKLISNEKEYTQKELLNCVYKMSDWLQTYTIQLTNKTAFISLQKSYEASHLTLYLWAHLQEKIFICIQYRWIYKTYIDWYVGKGDKLKKIVNNSKCCFYQDWIKSLVKTRFLFIKKGLHDHFLMFST